MAGHEEIDAYEPIRRPAPNAQPSSQLKLKNEKEITWGKPVVFRPGRSVSRRTLLHGLAEEDREHRDHAGISTLLVFRD
jgi:hypothetical protein